MTVHRITTTDTLQSLAARYYGSAARWREIATANNLRPPYISERAEDQYGPQLAAYTIPTPIESGATSFALTGADPGFVRTGARVLLQQRVTSGAQLSDAAIVVSYDGAAVTVEAPIVNSYIAGVALTVYQPPGNLHGEIAQPGDNLIIPGLEGSTEQATSDDRFGRDLAVDAAGRLLLDPQGDIAIQSGKANMIQQLQLRLSCDRGSLPRHVDYGCGAQSLIGSASVTTLGVLLQGQMALALSEDPRVGSVEHVGVTIAADLVQVSARVIANNEGIDFALVIGR